MHFPDITAVKIDIKDISSLISEKYPYILPFEVTSYSQNKNLILELEHNQRYYNEHFDELLQTISTIGSYCVALKINSAGKKSYLGHHLRIRKHNFLQISDAPISANAIAVIENERRAKAIINMFSDGVIIYSFELEYTIVTEDNFIKLFSHCYDPQYHDKIKLKLPICPTVINEYINDDIFNIRIEKFSTEHCAGHFENYPIVPAVRATECLINGVRLWMRNRDIDTSRLIMDSLEMFPNLAMPVDISYTSNVIVKRTSKTSLMFLCSIKDDQGKEYGNYILGIKNV